ncbi:MAG: hypothetical protein WAM96_02880 [Candidatus Acidiferrales bacterium]
MLRLGVPIDVTRADLASHNPPSALQIDVTGGDLETGAFDLRPGGTGYRISLSLTVLREPFAIAAFELELPWTSSPVIWLSDPAEGNASSSIYRFPGRHSDQFPRDSVINHRADARRSLSRGQCIEGFLLGYGSDSIPDCFQHGGHVPGTFGVVDQFGELHSTEINFWLDRSSKLSSRKGNAPPRESIFAERVCSGKS